MLTRRPVLATLLALPWAVQARPAELSTELPGAKLQGQGLLRFLGLRVYNARLWVAEGFKPEEYALHPVALELEYARDLVGKLIAERSLVEMRKVGDVPQDKGNAWLAAMEQAFPDVKAGDRITGLYKPGEGMRFFVNGKAGREVRDAAFAQLFIGIWLSPRSSEPALRRALLGLA
ncbi:chalcone isomerase family protein [Piscinibacter sp. HJYY11]|uniref:chalcone isomerase family protein n=1 Tax=Piscinibacter sp. HJYY11 TaxID=2801333 RepID=UPI00191EEEB6|nr:chalcone isomerase family protein [Piscinibacter sp. HJYY11]MBL0728683.1 chalcone isomerase family protein [Piscinibacter sp. HJYY11]